MKIIGYIIFGNGNLQLYIEIAENTFTALYLKVKPGVEYPFLTNFVPKTTSGTLVSNGWYYVPSRDYDDWVEHQVSAAEGQGD